MEENYSGDQASNSPAVRPDAEQTDRPTSNLQESDRSTPQIQIHRQADVRHAALPSQLPITTFMAPYRWKDLVKPDLLPTDFDAVLSGVLQSPTEVEKIKELNEADLQSVIDVLGEVRAHFDSVSVALDLLTPHPPVLEDQRWNERAREEMF